MEDKQNYLHLSIKKKKKLQIKEQKNLSHEMHPLG